MNFLIENRCDNWNDFFASRKEMLKKIDDELSARSKKEVIFPQKESIFKAFQLTNPQEISVVILGQDPYHGENEAMGLSFSVPQNVKIPPSLRNIGKELASDLGITLQNGDLTNWAKQNVLLLNSILTVAKDTPASHSKIGWSNFTDDVISYLSEIPKPKVFVLWGNFAQSKKCLINQNLHKIIESVHPSPLSASRGFFGSKPFSQINEFLRTTGQKEIDWQN
jgi:uracil-DNA glycosylase